MYMIQEYMNCFDLATLVQERGPLKQEETRKIMRQLLLGLQDLKKSNIVHCNLSLSSIQLHFPKHQ